MPKYAIGQQVTFVNQGEGFAGMPHGVLEGKPGTVVANEPLIMCKWQHYVDEAGRTNRKQPPAPSQFQYRVKSDQSGHIYGMHEHELAVR